MAEKVVERRVTGIGVGRPDYSAEVWRGKFFKRIELKPEESIKEFTKCFSTTPSPYPWMTDPLPSGETVPLMDPTTGLDMPYTFPAGYELEILMLWISCDQNTRNMMFFDEFMGVPLLAGEYYYPANTIYYESEVKELSSRDFDPAFAHLHSVIFSGTNLGVADMHGLVKVICLLRAHGTELPKTKTVKCKFCGATVEVPVETTVWKCPKCGKMMWFKHYPWGGVVR